MDVMEKDIYFTPLHRRIAVKDIASVDTEDDGKGRNNSLRIIGFYHNGKYWHFKNRYDFINFLYKYKTKGKLYVVATNIEYDAINLFRNFWDSVELFYGNHMIYAKLKKRKIYFFDSLNHYKESVKKMGEVVGMQKLEEDVSDIDKIPFKRLMEYNKRDCEITHHFIVEYQKRLNDVGAEMNYTIASSALNLFRRNYFHKRILKPKDEVLEAWRRGYYGGRTEIFTMKATGTDANPIVCVDINSLYPSVMHQNQFPVPDSYMECKDINEFGMVECDVEVFDCYVPYLPKRWEGKLVFPVGRIHGTWTGFELQYALKHKMIKVLKIYKAWKFTEHYDFFSQYVDKLYTMRKKAVSEKDGFMDISLKLLLNSLYGKFGERVESKISMSSEGELHEIALDQTYFPRHTNFIWSIYVTAYARTKLFEGCKIVVDNKCQLLYTDTDSIFYRKRKTSDPDGLRVSKELGDFKVEGLFRKAEFFQPKAYKLERLDGKEIIKVKGVPKKYAKDFLEHGYAIVHKPIRLRESIKRTDKINFSANRWVDIKKVFTSRYDKRDVIDNKGNTKPLILKEF